MIKKLQNISLSLSVFLIIFFIVEIFLRLFGTELRIFLSDAGRTNKVRAEYQEYVTAALNSGVTDKTFNIYFLGESTMWGVPYGPELSIPNIVAYQLKEINQPQVKIINLSSAAKDLIYSDILLKFILKNKDVFHPSLLIIYSGNNEFLKFHPSDPDFDSPILSWLVSHSELARLIVVAICRSNGEILEIDERKLFDQSLFPFDRHGYNKVIEHYKKKFLNLAEETKEKNVPLIISTIINNHADWEPNRSLFCGSNQARKQHFTQAFNRGLQAERDQKYNASLAAYNEALSICNSFAEVHFRKGKVLQATGNYKEAGKEFREAIDHDGMPIRATSAQNDFIKSLGSSYPHIKVADLITLFENHSPNGLLGDNLIIDGVHPNLEGYLLAGEVITDKIMTFLPKPIPLKPLDPETAKKVFNLSENKLYDVAFNTGRWICRLATWRYDPEKRLETSERFFREAIKMEPKRYEGFMGLGIALSLKKESKDAEPFLEKASVIDSKDVNQYLNKPWVRKVIKRSNPGLFFAA